MSTVDLNLGNFEQTVLGHEIVVVDFWAPWCDPCRTFGPVFDAASEQHTDVVFGKVNTDDERELAQAFDVQSIPMLMVFREQVLVFAQPGALPSPMLEELLSQVKALDMEDVRRQIAEADVEGEPEAS